jgi:hypothetical protein
MKVGKYAVLVLLAMAAAGCGQTPGAAGSGGGARELTGAAWVKTELYFGLSRKGAADVTEEQWEKFVSEEVTPRFPDGLTVIDARGQWKSGQAIVREPSRVLVVVHPPGRIADQKIEEIRRAYMKQFGQESVMRADEEAEVEF